MLGYGLTDAGVRGALMPLAIIAQRNGFIPWPWRDGTPRLAYTRICRRGNVMMSAVIPPFSAAAGVTSGCRPAVPNCLTSLDGKKAAQIISRTH
jgi:hypothetical protein